MNEQGEFLQKTVYKIGQLRFGDGTNMPVSKVEIQPYNVTNQDFQIIRTDETRFGIDVLVPAPIVFTMAVLNNWALDNMPASAGGPVPQGLLYQARSLLGQLAQTWKATPVRQTWGSMVKLLFIDTDGKTRRIYGRPGKFQHGPVEQNEWVDVQAEFRRADTNAYDDVEKVIEIGFNNDPTYIFREPEQGDAPAWFRVLMYGPITHPVVSVGKVQIELNLDIPSNCIVEVSSYPWMRRIVDSNNINWRAALIGSSQYLDQLQIPAETEIALRWTDQSYTTWTALDSTVTVQNPDFLDMFACTSEWHTLNGIPIWGFSLQNGGYMFAPFGITAVLDLNHTYTAPSQFAEATIADLWRGTTTMCILCNDNMTNFAGLQVLKTVGIGNIVGEATANDKIRIVTGNYWTPQNCTTQFEYAVPSPGLHSTDKVAIVCNGTNSSHTLFMAYYNGNYIGQWDDTGLIVDQANRRQGFIMNQDDALDNIGLGVAWNDLVAYDASFNPTGPPSDPNDLSSRMFLYWRDAWSIE
jgi:hypothetical protein